MINMMGVICDNLQGILEQHGTIDYATLLQYPGTLALEGKVVLGIESL